MREATECNEEENAKYNIYYLKKSNWIYSYAKSKTSSPKMRNIGSNYKANRALHSIWNKCSILWNFVRVIHNIQWYSRQMYRNELSRIISYQFLCLFAEKKNFNRNCQFKLKTNLTDDERFCEFRLKTNQKERERERKASLIKSLCVCVLIEWETYQRQQNEIWTLWT